MSLSKLDSLRISATPLVVAVAWGSAFVWTKLGVGRLDPINLVIVRMAIAAMGFLLLFRIGAIGYRRIALSDLTRFLLLVLLGVLVYHISLAIGETKLPASIAILIDQATPVFTLAVASSRSRNWPTVWAAFGMAVAACGALVAVGAGMGPGCPTPTLYCLITLAAPASFACYTVLAEPLVVRYGPANLTGQVVVAGAAILLTTGAFRPSLVADLRLASLETWMALLALGLLCTTMAYTLWFEALARRSAAGLSAYLYLVPISGIALAALVLGEPLQPLFFAGGIVVVAGVAVVEFTTPLPQTLTLSPKTESGLPL